MIYLAASLVIVAVLAWDGWRRWVAHRAEVERRYGLDDAKTQSIDLATEHVSLRVDALALAVENQRLSANHTTGIVVDHTAEIDGLEKALEFLGGKMDELAARLDSAEMTLRHLTDRVAAPVDITEFRTELDKHRRALETIATSTQASVVELKGLIDNANAKSAASLMTGLNPKVKYRT